MLDAACDDVVPQGCSGIVLEYMAQTGTADIQCGGDRLYGYIMGQIVIDIAQGLADYLRDTSPAEANSERMASFAQRRIQERQDRIRISYPNSFLFKLLIMVSTHASYC